MTNKGEYYDSIYINNIAIVVVIKTKKEGGLECGALCSNPFGACSLNNFSLFSIRAITTKSLKETKSVTMNIFRKKYFLFKSFVKVELSYVFTIKMLSTAENWMEK